MNKAIPSHLRPPQNKIRIKQNKILFIYYQLYVIHHVVRVNEMIRISYNYLIRD